MGSNHRKTNNALASMARQLKRQNVATGLLVIVVVIISAAFFSFKDQAQALLDALSRTVVALGELIHSNPPSPPM